MTAIEDTLLLAIPKKSLEKKLNEDLKFAAQVYKSLAQISAKRLLSREATYGSIIDSKKITESINTQTWARLSTTLENLKKDI